MRQDRKLMTDSDLKAALENRRAVVVHFSHHANMRAGGALPSDLQNAIKNKDNWALSCSVLWPGHNMQPCGSVGVIFQPTVASVLSVSNTDAGSYTGSDGTDNSAGHPLDMDTFERTFQVNGYYNEWRVKGADVVGIFIHNLNCMLAKKKCEVPIPDDPDGNFVSEIVSVRIGIAEIFTAFDLPVFTMGDSRLIEISRDNYKS